MVRLLYAGLNVLLVAHFAVLWNFISVDLSNDGPKESLDVLNISWPIEQELMKHDRYLVEGVAFVNSYDRTKTWSPHPLRRPHICMNIFARRYPHPYLSALLMSLLRGQHPKRLTDAVHTNVLHINGMGDKDNMLKPLQSFVDSITMEPSEHPLLSALNLCLDSETSFCLLLEQHVIAPINFVETLNKNIIAPLRKRSDFAQIGYVTLYERHPAKLWDPTYTTYEMDRAKSNSERRVLGLSPHIMEFTLVPLRNQSDLTPDAILLPKHQVSRLFALAQTHTGFTLAQLLEHLVTDFRTKAIQVHPSLINRIGFYDNQSQLIKDMDTDVRFILDPGT